MARPPKPIGMTTGNFLPGEIEKRKECEPQLFETNFIPPPELNEIELEHWNELTEIFKRIKGNAVNDADRRLIQQACECWGNMDYDKKKLKDNRDPMIYIKTGNAGADGKPKVQLVKNPYSERLEKTRANYISCLDKLQLSPTSRARIGKGRADNSDLDDNFF